MGAASIQSFRGKLADAARATGALALLASPDFSDATMTERLVAEANPKAGKTIQ